MIFLINKNIYDPFLYRENDWQNEQLIKKNRFFLFEKNSSFLDNLSQLYFSGILIQLANICSFFFGRSFWEAKSNFWIHKRVCMHTHTYIHNSKFWKTFEQKIYYHKWFYFFFFFILFYFMDIVDSLLCIFLLIYFTEMFFYYNLFYVSNTFQEIYLVKIFYNFLTLTFKTKASKGKMKLKDN